MKLEYHIDDFITYCVEKGLSRKTYGSYEQTLVLLARYLREEQGIERVEDVKKEHLRDYITYLRERGKYTITGNDRTKIYNYPENRMDYGKKISDVTINNYIRNIKVFFNYLAETREIKSNPVKAIKLIKVARKSLYYISDSEYKRFLDVFDLSKLPEYRDYVIVNTLMDTGMRVGECLMSRADDIDFGDRIIRIEADHAKGKTERYVFFSKKLSTELKRWMNYKDRYLESDLMFPTIRNTELQVTNFEMNIRKYAQRIGIKKIHPHVFRNNFAKRFLLNGGDIYTLSRILGHSSVEVTEKAYLDLDTSDLKAQYVNHSPLANMSRR